VLFGHSFSTVAQSVLLPSGPAIPADQVSLASSRVLALIFEPQLKPEALILLEMSCVAPDNVEAIWEYFLRSCLTRHDVWLSAEEAYAMLKSRPTWATWDESVLRI
jgi:hypothetical protein